MSKLGDLQNILQNLKDNVDTIKKDDILTIITELLNYTIEIEKETIQLLQNRQQKESGQATINWEALRLDSSPFKINPLHT